VIKKPYKPECFPIGAQGQTQTLEFIIIDGKSHCKSVAIPEHSYFLGSGLFLCRGKWFVACDVVWFNDVYHHPRKKNNHNIAVVNIKLMYPNWPS
jgi:hypothetical protein